MFRMNACKSFVSRRRFLPFRTHTGSAMLTSSNEVGDLAEETGLPRELVQRFFEMWGRREPPFFMHVTEGGMLEMDHLAELVRSLRVSSVRLCRSACRVIGGGKPAVSFRQFVLGYAKLHSRTLKDALPFAFAVADEDGDGKLSQDEFTGMVRENLGMQQLDSSAIERVLASPGGKDAQGVGYDAFRYFASLSSETILATCGFFFHVRDFYVPLAPFGTEEEEAEEEAKRREGIRRERETEHVPAAARGGGGAEGGGGSESGGGDVGGADGEVSHFEDPDFLAAIESLRTTPEERATRCKEKGNDALSQKGIGNVGVQRAVEHYGEGLDERCVDDVLNATLHANRAAAHVMLKNWGKALVDAVAAADSGALADATQRKALRRAATSAWKLEKVEEAEGLLEQWAALPAADDADADERQKVAKGVAAVKRARAERRRKEEAEAKRASELEAAIDARGLIVGGWEDEALRQQCTGGSSGARVWWDAELDELHWPVLLLYPETAQSDMIQDLDEGEPLLPQFVEMFGLKGERSPPWDTRREYRANDLRAYAMYERDADGKQAAKSLRADRPLLPQLARAMRDKGGRKTGYTIRGIPIVHVVVKGSAYEKQYFLPIVDSGVKLI